MARRGPSPWLFVVGVGIGAAGVATAALAAVLVFRSGPPSVPTRLTPVSATDPTRPKATRPASSPPIRTGETLRVGTWNIEWLGKPENRHNKQAQTAEDIAGYIAASQVDILALNEVTGDADGGAANATIAKALPILKQLTGDEWRQTLFPKENKSERDQLTGVLWNTGRASLVGEPFRVPVRRSPGEQSMLNRHPYAAKFSAGERRTDVVLIPVHLKSNRGGKDTTSNQRADEAKAVARSLGAVQNQFADDDLIVLGDYNCLKADEPALKLLGAVGLHDLNAADDVTWIKGETFPAAPFDRVFVPDDQPEFKASAQRVIRESPVGGEDDFRRRLSDHQMVVIDVKVGPDDD